MLDEPVVAFDPIEKMRIHLQFQKIAKISME